jgi:hypothetical protein
MILKIILKIRQFWQRGQAETCQKAEKIAKQMTASLAYNAFVASFVRIGD